MQCIVYAKKAIVAVVKIKVVKLEYSMNESYGFASSKDLIIIISIVQNSFMVVKSGL